MCIGLNSNTRVKSHNFIRKHTVFVPSLPNSHPIQPLTYQEKTRSDSLIGGPFNSHGCIGPSFLHKNPCTEGSHLLQIQMRLKQFHDPLVWRIPFSQQTWGNLSLYKFSYILGKVMWNDPPRIDYRAKPVGYEDTWALVEFPTIIAVLLLKRWFL